MDFVNRPTPEQIATSRARAQQLLAMGDVPMNYISDVMTLLAATDPPTGEEIAIPAARFVAGIGYGGVAEDALSVVKGNPPKYTEYEFDGEVRAFAAGVRHFLGPVKP